MELRTGKKLPPQLQNCYLRLLKLQHLRPESGISYTAALMDQDIMAAAGSLRDNLLCCIAVDPRYEGRGCTAPILTALRQEAFRRGYRQLFLCTNPANQALFTPFLFEPVCSTADVLLLESPGGGLQTYLRGLQPQHGPEPVGALVMHGNPPTLGHLHLIETAAGDCGWLHVFVLSEETGLFPAADRLQLVRQMTGHLPNVSVHSTGGYLLSAATFPTYFLKEAASGDPIRCGLDITLFRDILAPYLHISRRYVGTEPFCPVTAAYNVQLQQTLPGCGIAVRELPRFCVDGCPVSATRVRKLLQAGQWEAVRSLVPPAVFSYLLQNYNKDR